MNKLGAATFSAFLIRKVRASHLGFSLWLVALSAFLQSLVSTAQTENRPDFLWVKSGATTNSAFGSSVAVDPTGNVFVAGYFEGRLDLGGTNLWSYGGNDWDDAFVAKYDSVGNLLWAHRAGGSGLDVANSVAADQAGNCYVTGFFRNVADFSGITITDNSMPNSSAFFLAKYDPQGTVVWVKKGDGVDGGADGIGVALDSQGNPYVTGEFFGTVFFDGLSISTRLAANIFVAKFSSSGDPLWVRQASTNSTGYGLDIAVDHDACYVTGFYNTAATFGETTLTASTNAAGIFLVRYDSNGNVLWARQAAGPRPNGGSVSDSGHGVGVDRAGNVYLSGFFGGAIAFDRFTLTNSGFRDIFLAKYDSLGNVLWVRQAGGTADDGSSGLAIDPAGNAYVTGFFSSSPATFGTDLFATRGDWDVFVAKYDTGGNFRGLAQAGGTGWDYGFAISLDTLGNVYLAGAFGSVQSAFGNSALTNGGTVSFFVAKLAQFPPTLSIRRSADGIVLGWPLWATNFQLESAVSIPASVAWTQVANPFYPVGGENVVSNGAADPKSFYRLRKR